MEAPTGKPEQSQYEERYVAYLDIMGYGELVKRNAEPERAKARIEELRKAIKKQFEIKNVMSLPDTAVRVLSDTVLVSCAANHEGCFNIILQTMNVVGGFACSNYWVRGAITRGWHYDDGSVLFSPAMVEAYQTGEKEAFYPRVLIAGQVVLDSRNMGLSEQVDSASQPFWEARRDTLRHSISRDQDGREFLNYLHLADPERSCTMRDAEAYLRLHRDHIASSQREYAQDERVAAKYGWLASYHNRFCEEHGIPDEYLVPDAGS